jgi:DNA-binding response OmpR family regulator
MTAGDAREVLIVEDNLFFHAKLEGLLRVAGWKSVVVSSEPRFAAALDEAPVAMLVSVACRRIPWAQWVERARARLGASFPIVAYGGHVNETGLAAGRDAGCTLVVTNGQISAQAPEILARLTQV